VEYANHQLLKNLFALGRGNQTRGSIASRAKRKFPSLGLRFGVGSELVNFREASKTEKTGLDCQFCSISPDFILR